MSDLRHVRLGTLHSPFLKAAGEFPFLCCAAVAPQWDDPLWPQTQVSPGEFHIGLLAIEWRHVLGIKHPPLPVPLCGTRWIWMESRLWEAAFYDSRNSRDFRGEYASRNIDTDALRAEDARNETAIGEFKVLARQCAGNLNLKRPEWFELNDIVKSDDPANRWLEKLFSMPFVDKEGQNNTMQVRRMGSNVFSASAKALELIIESNDSNQGETHSEPSAPPGPLLSYACQILGLAKSAVQAGNAIIKIRELYPDDPTIRIEEIMQVTVNLSNIVIYLAPTCPTEDPRGGKVPLYRRALFASWFADNPRIQQLFARIWDAHTTLPDTLRPAVNRPSEGRFVQFERQLKAFEIVVTELDQWYQANIPQPFAPRPHQPSAKELSIIYRAMRDTQQSRPTTLPEQINADAEAKADALTQFTGGKLKFFGDRVELCGVDICSGRRSKSKRRLLDVLAEKRHDGTFNPLSGKDLSAKSGIREGSLPGAIRDLRRGITAKLREKCNIECGDEDVIQTDNGYRLSQILSVQIIDGALDHGHGAQAVREHVGDGVRNVRDDGGVNVRDVRNQQDRNVRDQRSRRSPQDRRAWILRELSSGRELRAPDVMQEFSCSKKTAERDFAFLKKEAKVEFLGPPRTGFFQLKQK